MTAHTHPLTFDGMYSTLIDDDDTPCSEFSQYVERRGAPIGRAPRIRPPAGPYRQATVLLTVLCLVLLVCLIAVASHYKGIEGETGEGQTGRQEQEVNVTSLEAALRHLQQENAELLAKLAAKANTAPPVVRTVAPPVRCPEGWLPFQGSCYMVSQLVADWKASQQSCQGDGGHLAIIHTPEEQGFLWDLLPRGHWNAYWIGLSDEHTEDDWKWVDGTPLVGGFWEEGEPNNHIDEDCGYMVKTRKLERVAVRSWYDAPCSMFLPFICQKVLGSMPNPPIAPTSH
ncbi:unnamed protein product [Lota lota]